MVQVQFVASLVTAVIELVFFTGLIFGWSSINYVLKKEGYFSNLCEQLNDGNASAKATGTNRPIDFASNTSTTIASMSTAMASPTECNSQDETLNLVFTISSFLLSVCTLPNGFIFDKFGTWVARTIAIILITFGALLLSFSSVDSSLLLFPAMCGFSIGGILLLVTNMQLGNLFPRFKSSIITLMNGSLDSSSVVFLLVKLSYDSGVSFNAIFQFIACCTVFLWLRTIFVMPRTHIPVPLPSSGYKFGLHDCPSLKQQSADVTDRELNLVEKEKGDKEAESDVVIRKEDDKVPSFGTCIKTTIFWMNVFHFSILQLRNYFFFSSFISWLSNILKDTSEDFGTYVNAFGICQFFGIVCAPLNGVLIDGVKYHHKSNRDVGVINLLAISISACVTSSWGALFSILLLIPSPKVQYVSFVLQVAFRSFLYGGNASFIALVFPLEHFGKIYGMTMTLGGLISLLQFPLYSLVLRSFDGNFLVMNIIFLVACLLTYVHPIYLYIKSRKALKAEKETILGIKKQSMVDDKSSSFEKDG